MIAVFLDEAGHLWSEDREALHRFACGIGLRRDWFQDRPVLYHYDLTTLRKRREAGRAGAIEVHSRNLVRMMTGRTLIARAATEPAEREARDAG